MRVLVALEQHFMRDPEGHVYPAPPGVEGYGFWQRYLEVFEEVVVLARVRMVSRELPGASRADGPCLTFCDLPDYLGPWQYVRHLPKMRRRVWGAVRNADAFILRGPGAISHLAWREIRKRRAPFAVQVVGDPWDALSPGTTRSILRPMVRRLMTREVRLICQEACAVSYVTREALQRRYPPGPGAWATALSDIDLRDGLIDPDRLEARISRIRSQGFGSQCGETRWRVGFAGMLNSFYKAPDVLLRAVATCLKGGLRLDLAFVGDGRCKPEVERLAARLGLTGFVRFLGALPSGEPVRAFLDEVDLFVLPSRAEGLPRAMIEAMARGCPCIGSTVGGIPELLPPEDMVTPGDAEALTQKIVEVLSDPQRMERMARRNWETAKQYLPEIHSERLREFCRKVRALAEGSP